MIHIFILLSEPLYSLVDPLYLQYISICGSYYSDAKSGPDLRILTINDINYEETYWYIHRYNTKVLTQATNSSVVCVDQGMRSVTIPCTQQSKASMEVQIIQDLRLSQIQLKLPKNTCKYRKNYGMHDRRDRGIPRTLESQDAQYAMASRYMAGPGSLRNFIPLKELHLTLATIFGLIVHVTLFTLEAVVILNEYNVAQLVLQLVPHKPPINHHEELWLEATHFHFKLALKMIHQLPSYRP
ncbi:hypothetical protein DFP73DRAFT_522588 [Morchella snyderi]|nr:hypothetical protein DFP73DRAFT_522588 [Morchella snyderi]